MIPLSYIPLESASNFSSEQCNEGIVSISANTLRIITIDRLGEVLNQREIPLIHTPRKFVIHPATNNLIIIETDNNSLSNSEIQYVIDSGKTNNNNNNNGTSDGKTEEQEQEQEQEIPFSQNRLIREYKPGNGKWASCIRVLDPTDYRTLNLLELTENEAAYSICTVVFRHSVDSDTTASTEVYLAVGTAKDLVLKPRSCAGGFIHIYRIVEGRQLELLHKTPVEDLPSALCPFQGRLLVGLGKTLRIYDLGKKKLLRKCENKSFPNFINAIQTMGDRIYVSDIQESVHFVKYKKVDNQLYIFADETTPKWMTSSILLDYDTVCGADKFGNIFISRLPSQVSDDVEDDPTGSKLRIEQGYLNGAAHKLEEINFFHVGETINSISKTSLIPGGAEVIIYTTIMGGIGALLPFASREDVDFFTHLEMHLRQENPPLCGRDHLSYRSYYFPVKDIIDGDLCEQFSTIDPEKQKTIAEELDRTPSEVMKKLEDIRNRLL